MHPQLEAALDAGSGVVLRREHPELAEAIKRACRTGALVRVLNGVHVAGNLADSVEHRVRALVCFDPDAIVTGAAAARLTWWPELPVSTITAYRRPHCQPAKGFDWARSRPEPELVTGNVAVPELQVLDLLPQRGADAVDEALRRRAVTLAGLHRALELTPGRPGNQLRRAILDDSRDEPWSPAEREFHRVLRAERIAGWRANFRIRLDGHVYFLDVALPDLRLAFEVDGFEHHGSRSAFERDRSRDTVMAAHGWLTVRLSAAQVSDSGPRVRAVIAARATQLRRSFRQIAR